MSIVVSDLSERLDTLTKLVLAEPVARIGHSRVTVRPLTLRGKAFFQLEYQQGQKVAHRNVARGALLETFEQELDGLFRSVTLCTETETRQYVRKTNGAYKCTAKSGAARAAVTASHNRKKEYILQEGENIPALVDLGVFTPDFKIVKAKYDKYKQINRFIELVDDAFRAYGRDEITILDAGGGEHPRPRRPRRIYAGLQDRQGKIRQIQADQPLHRAGGRRVPRLRPRRDHDSRFWLRQIVPHVRAVLLFRCQARRARQDHRL